jgi:hypothetical protein
MLGPSLFEGLFFCWDDDNRTLRIDKCIYKEILRCQDKFDRFCKSSTKLYGLLVSTTVIFHQLVYNET